MCDNLIGGCASASEWMSELPVCLRVCRNQCPGPDSSRSLRGAAASAAPRPQCCTTTSSGGDHRTPTRSRIHRDPGRPGAGARPHFFGLWRIRFKISPRCADNRRTGNRRRRNADWSLQAIWRGTRRCMGRVCTCSAHLGYAPFPHCALRLRRGCACTL